MPNVLLIEPCDFREYPIGGQLTFAKQMMAAFGNQLALVGACTDSTPIGSWIDKFIDGQTFKFFSTNRWTKTAERPLIPRRLSAYIHLRRNQRAILSLGVRNAFVRAPEALLAVSDWGWDSLCYFFPGLTNPLAIPRYALGKLLARTFFDAWIRSTTKADVILAAADERRIDAFVSCTGGKLTKNRIVKFPTRVDTSIFRPMPKCVSREILNIDKEIPLVVNCGRINHAKGWEFLCDAFRVLLRNRNNAHMVFVGDGEDRPKLQRYIRDHDLVNNVKIAGFRPANQVRDFLNAADVVAVGSYYEGWSLSMLEALACAKPIVSTDVSGAKDMIVEGENGFIIENRNHKCFAEAMNRALFLPEAKKISLRMAEKYAVKNLARDLRSVWEPLRQADSGSLK